MFSDLKQIFEYRELLRTLVSKDIRSRYKGSILGFAWNFAIPLLQLMVFYILFGIIIKTKPPGNYPFAIFLFTGLLPWNFLANSMMGGSMAIVGNANLVKKIYFPLQILPFTKVMAEFIAMLLGMIVLAIILIVFHVGIGPMLFFLPLPFVVEFIFAAGLAYFFSSANVFFRDVQHIIGIVVMAWMYVTPVLYPITLIQAKPAWAQFIVNLNPMTTIINFYQKLILDHTFPDMRWFAYSTVAAVVVFVVGFMVFNRYKFRFEEEI